MKRLMLFTLAILILALSFSACGEHKCKWGEWQPVEGKEATCTEMGNETRVCRKDSSHTQTRRVKALGHQSSAPATLDSAEYCDRCGCEISPKLHKMSGKKIIFIGNSHTYVGGVVQSVSQDKMKISDRDHDQGYFYHLCKANGAEVEVLNWTFGNHSLKDLFSGNCQANRSCGNGTNHLAHLTDNNFDYVVFQNGSTAGDEILEWIDFLMNFFKAGNPNTKFVMLVQARAHNDHAADATKYTWLSDLDVIENKGVTIVDWGKVVYDLYSGAVTLPGENILPFTKTSFVVAASAADGYHPNLLAGYVASLMTYCAITGESAVGQPYEFCSTVRKFSSFVKNQYKVDSTNFPEIFASEETMAALQQMIDTYYEEKAFRNY